MSNNDFNYHFYNKHNPALYPLLRSLHKHREELRKDIGQTYAQREGNIASIGSLQDEIERGIIKDSRALAMATGNKDQMVGFAEDDKTIYDGYDTAITHRNQVDYFVNSLRQLTMYARKLPGYSPKARFTIYEYNQGSTDGYKLPVFVFDHIFNVRESKDKLLFVEDVPEDEGPRHIGIDSPTTGILKLLTYTRSQHIIDAWKAGEITRFDVNQVIEMIRRLGLWNDINDFQKLKVMNDIKEGLYGQEKDIDRRLQDIGDPSSTKDEDYLAAKKIEHKKRLEELEKKKKNFEGSGIKIVKNMDELVDRLEVLMGSRAAGNNSKAVFNEIVEILDVLKKHKHITNTEYNQFYKELIKD